MKKEQLEYINIIQQAISKNKLALFVGSGVSINSNIPSWGGLIQELAKELKIKKSNEFTVDEIIKIPQLYYNKFSESKYNDKIKLLLCCENAKPNPLHDLLFDLNPQYIITTNYDSLIEDTAKEKKEFFSVVRKDEDFPGTNNNKMIIKMHGDIETGNFVLKEDDYISYSKDFVLTETFIKGLFSTHVILFIGYSVSDPNVKQIFTWVKDVLGDKRPSAFLLNIEPNKMKNKNKIHIPNNIENEYFKQKGIVKLDYSDYKTKIEEYRKKTLFSNKRANCLYDFLYFVKAYENKENLIDYFYNMLSFLEPLNYIKPTDIQKIISLSLEDCQYYPLRSKFIFSSCNDFKNLITILNAQKRHSSKTKRLFKIFNKAGIESINYNSQKNMLNPKNRKKPIFFEVPNVKDTTKSITAKLREFNYVEILEDINKKVDYSHNSLDLFEKAYILFNIGKNIEAYQELEKISYYAHQENNYIVYAIAETNRLLVGKELSLKISFSDDVKKETEEYKIIKESLDKNKKIDKQKIINKILPEDYKLIFKDIMDFTCFLNLFVSMSDRDSRLQNSYKNTPNTFDCDDYFHLNNLFEEFYSFINDNFLFFNTKDKLGIDIIKKIIHIHIDASLKSYCTKNERVYNQKKYFNYDNDIFIMVKHLKPYELLQFFDEYKIKKLRLSEGNINEEQRTKKKIFHSFNNLIDSIIELGSKENQFLDYYNNFLLILSRLNITKIEFIKIIDTYTKIGKEPKYLKEFLKCVYNKNPKVISLNSIKKLLNITIEQLENKAGHWAYDLEKEEEFFIFLLNYYKITNKKLSLNKNINKRFIECLSRFFVPFGSKKRICSIIPLNDIFNNEIQLKIKNNLLNLLDNNFTSNVYYEACLNNIIQPREDYESQLLIDINTKIVQKDENCINFLNAIANLINNEKIIQREEFKRFLGKSAFFDFCFDIEEFDYNNFDLKFLLHTNENNKHKLIQILKTKPEIKNILVEKFKKLSEKDLSKNEYENIKNIFVEIV